MTEQESNKKHEMADGDSQAPNSFRRQLAQHSKAALVNLVDQLTSDGEVNRGWMLQYLQRVDALMKENDNTLPDRLTTQQFLLIARYEMYANVSLNKGRDVTEVYMGSLSEAEKQLLDQYMNVKVQALCGEMVNFDTLAVDLNKEADAPSAIGTPAESESLENQ